MMERFTYEFAADQFTKATNLFFECIDFLEDKYPLPAKEDNEVDIRTNQVKCVSKIITLQSYVCVDHMGRWKVTLTREYDIWDDQRAQNLKSELIIEVPDLSDAVELRLSICL